MKPSNIHQDMPPTDFSWEEMQEGVWEKVDYKIQKQYAIMLFFGFLLTSILLISFLLFRTNVPYSEQVPSINQWSKNTTLSSITTASNTIDTPKYSLPVVNTIASQTTQTLAVKRQTITPVTVSSTKTALVQDNNKITTTTDSSFLSNLDVLNATNPNAATAHPTSSEKPFLNKNVRFTNRVSPLPTLPSWEIKSAIPTLQTISSDLEWTSDAFSFTNDQITHRNRHKHKVFTRQRLLLSSGINSFQANIKNVPAATVNRADFEQAQIGEQFAIRYEQEFSPYGLYWGTGFEYAVLRSRFERDVEQPNPEVYDNKHLEGNALLYLGYQSKWAHKYAYLNVGTRFNFSPAAEGYTIDQEGELISLFEGDYFDNRPYFSASVEGGLRYDLSPRLSLFGQFGLTYSLKNWVLPSQEVIQRPLVYQLSFGIAQRF